MQEHGRFGLAAKLVSTALVALAAATAGSSWAQTSQLRPPAGALGTAPRENKINEFNENAHKNDALYSAYKPKPSFNIPDEFKARYKVVKAWIDGDVLHVATDAKMKLTVAQVLVPNQQYTKTLAMYKQGLLQRTSI
jgi:hypothetical protein